MISVVSVSPSVCRMAWQKGKCRCRSCHQCAEWHWQISVVSVSPSTCRMVLTEGYVWCQFHHQCECSERWWVHDKCTLLLLLMVLREGYVFHHHHAERREIWMSVSPSPCRIMLSEKVDKYVGHTIKQNYASREMWMSASPSPCRMTLAVKCKYGCQYYHRTKWHKQRKLGMNVDLTVPLSSYITFLFILYYVHPVLLYIFL